MADAHLRDFYGRVYRIRKNYRRGGGFEAAGTLGRADFVPPPPVRLVPASTILRSLIYTLVSVTLLKALILANIGAADYGARLAVLAKGDALSRIGAVIMTADPVTTHAAGVIELAQAAGY
jgi:hypothetical protein